MMTLVLEMLPLVEDDTLPEVKEMLPEVEDEETFPLVLEIPPVLELPPVVVEIPPVEVVVLDTLPLVVEVLDTLPLVVEVLDTFPLVVDVPPVVVELIEPDDPSPKLCSDHHRNSNGTNKKLAKVQQMVGSIAIRRTGGK